MIMVRPRWPGRSAARIIRTNRHATDWRRTGCGGRLGEDARAGAAPGQDVGDDLVARAAGGGQGPPRGDLAPPAAGRLVLDRHDGAVAGDGGDGEAALDVRFLRVDGVVAGGGELLRQPAEQGAVIPAAYLDPARFAVLRLRQQRQLTARVLDHRLQPKADAEHGQPPRVELGQQLVALEVGRAAWSWREHDEVGDDLVEHDGGEAGAQGGDLRVVLAEVVRQGVHERVLVVHEEDAEPARPG